MKLQTGNYDILFNNGGVSIEKDGNVLYYNKRPMYVFIKTAMAVTEFFDKPYDSVNWGQDENQVI